VTVHPDIAGIRGASRARSGPPLLRSLAIAPAGRSGKRRRRPVVPVV
jgi:hypothetical protein